MATIRPASASTPSRVVLRRPLIALILIATAALWFFVRPNSNGERSLTTVLGLLTASYVAFWGTLALSGRYSRRDWLFRFVACTMAVVFCVLVFEVAALAGVDFIRIFRLDPMASWYSHNRQDPELLFIHQPHRHFAGKTKWSNAAYFWNLPTTREYEFDIRLDNNGFRNDQDLERADVVVVGDSFIEGREVLSQQTAVAGLGKSIQKPVANFGHTGYGPQQELAVLRRFALPLSPKVCVWVFYEGNDLEDVRNYDRIINGGPLAGASESALFRRTFTRNFTLAIATAIGKKEVSPLAAVRHGTFAGKAGRETMYFLEVGRPLSKQDEESLKRTGECLMEAKRLCDELGCRLIFAFAPNAIRVYRDHCVFPADSEIHGWVTNDLPQRLRTQVAEISADIGFVDLTEALQAAAAKGELVYLPEDTHWTPRGHAVVAETLARQVAAFLSDSRAAN